MHLEYGKLRQMNKWNCRILIILPLFFFSNACVKSVEIDIQTEEDFKKFLLDEMDVERIPALGVLIFDDDEILHESYLGKSQIDQNVSLEPDHLFLLASVSKVITAAALLQLYDQGLFNLDDPVNNYLPFAVNVPGYNQEITFRMLLTHTSGIADGDAMDSQYYYGEDSPIALAYFVENYLVPGGEFYYAFDNYYDFQPGTEHEYSNVGNALIAVLVEEISNQEFNNYCKQHIFNPLNMLNTYWRLDEIAMDGKFIVQPYTYQSGDFQLNQHYTFTDYPNGGLRSTPRDLYTFFSAFLNGGMVNSYQLLSSSTIQEMLNPQIVSIDNEVGLHLFRMDGANNLWGHDGGEQGVATIVGFNQDTKVGVIVLANEEDAYLDQILTEGYQFGLKLQ